MSNPFANPDACPWIEPPPWWRKSEEDWRQLVQQAWDEAGEELKRNPPHLWGMIEKIGQAFAEERTRFAIEMLTQKEPGL